MVRSDWGFSGWSLVLPSFNIVNKVGLACCDSWGRKESDTTEQLIWSEQGQRLHNKPFGLAWQMWFFPAQVDGQSNCFSRAKKPGSIAVISPHQKTGYQDKASFGKNTSCAVQREAETRFRWQFCGKAVFLNCPSSREKALLDTFIVPIAWGVLQYYPLSQLCSCFFGAMWIMHHWNSHRSFCL